jgi:catechol 2,3-dioxygenase-like lactoylglutathione lyase family enzyme
MAVGHFGLNVPDLTAARSYFDQVTPALGYAPFVVDDDSRRGAIVFCASAAPSADSRHTTGLQHVAFMVDTRAQVDAVRDLVAGLGARASDSV